MSHQSTWVMTHFNHPKELSREAREACARLADAGLPVMNQTVLLLGVKSGNPAMRKPLDEEGNHWMDVPPRGDPVDVYLVLEGEGRGACRYL